MYPFSRAGSKGRGPGANFTGGPHDVFHDVIVCKSYVFADSQGSCLARAVFPNLFRLAAPYRKE